MFPDTLTLTTDPAFPWSSPAYGMPALLLVVLLLGGLTIWTYRGLDWASARRLLSVVGLRLGALFLAIAALLRPAIASRDDLQVPSVLILLLDASESMTIQDEFGGLSRWEALRRTLEHCESALEQLRTEQNVTIHLKSFGETLADYDPKRSADGKRTDTGSALNQLFEELGQERSLRGLLVLSDGADNGTRFNAFTEAERWRRRGCPVHTFALGQTTTSIQRQDIALVNIAASPTPVPVKNKLTITTTIDAPGFENALVPVRLFLDDREVKEALVRERLTRRTGNEVNLTIHAPERPGEIKVTVKVDPQLGEAIQANNEISTFVTVGKEGLSVLYVEGRLRAFEPKFIKYALQDPRIRLDEMVLLQEGPLPPDIAEVFRFDRQHYDVIILGDITARRLSGGDPAVLTRIRDQVLTRGTGLMLIGGFQAFGEGDWKTFGSPLAEILPVDLSEAGQLRQAIRIVPTREGLDRFVMRLVDNPGENEQTWSKLRLNEMSKLGQPRLDTGAVVLARAGDAVTGPPILVSRQAGNGRVLVFAGDTTWEWRNLGLPQSRQGIALHNRFWKQIVLWLAQQEETTNTVWIKLDARRLAAGDKLGFAVGLRGKGGIDLSEAEFRVKVVAPNQVEYAVPTNREADGQRGVFSRTEQAGEYRLVVRGKGLDTDGLEVSGEATARFLVYQDTAELARQAADHEFLARLANAGGGKALRAEELPHFLTELRHQPLPQYGHKIEVWPDWRSPRLSGFLVGYLLLFVCLLSLEWFLRRRWGLV